MKINRTFCIDAHLVEKLEQRVNKSQTVCDALEKFFKGGGADEEEMTKQLIIIKSQCFTPRLGPSENAQILTAFNTLLAFLQESFQDSA